MLEVLIIGPPLLLAVILHEVAHGLAAEKLGDPTARKLGRITLNPLKHIDPFMTIILPVMLKLAGAPVFAGAKPVPVNPLYFKTPRRGMAYVALAGPITNFILAAISYGLLVLLRGINSGESVPLAFIELWLAISITINLLLGGFNLLPIPPLDGGRIAVGFLPKQLARAWAKVEPWGILVVFALLYSGALDRLLNPLIKFGTDLAQ